MPALCGFLLGWTFNEFIDSPKIDWESGLYIDICHPTTSWFVLAARFIYPNPMRPHRHHRTYIVRRRYPIHTIDIAVIDRL